MSHVQVVYVPKTLLRYLRVEFLTDSRPVNWGRLDRTVGRWNGMKRNNLIGWNQIISLRSYKGVPNKVISKPSLNKNLSSSGNKTKILTISGSSFFNFWLLFKLLVESWLFVRFRLFDSTFPLPNNSRNMTVCKNIKFIVLFSLVRLFWPENL